MLKPAGQPPDFGEGAADIAKNSQQQLGLLVGDHSQLDIQIGATLDTKLILGLKIRRRIRWQRLV